MGRTAGRDGIVKSVTYYRSVDGLKVPLMPPSVWSTSITAWQAWLLAAGRPSTTVGLRTYQLWRFAAEHPAGPWRVTADSLTEWLAGHAKGWSTESLRSYRSALRSFYGWANATGRLPADPSRALPPIKPANHPPRPAPEPVVREALETTDRRVRLMVALAARQGMRRGEIARVHSDDLSRDLAGWTLRVHGKGGKIRDIPLHDDVAEALRGLPAGWAFPGPRGHLSAPYVGKLLSRHLAGDWTGHTLRHRFGTVVYADTRDLLAVQALLGHARPETTQHYVRLPDDALRSALRAA